MKTTGRSALRSLLWATGAAAAVAIAAEGQTADGSAYPAPVQPPPLPPTAIGALVFGENGELIVVDREGRPVPGCVISGSTEGTDLQPCRALADTTVQSLKSVGILRHTGSACMTIGPLVHAGAGYYFQLPPGCAP